MSVGSRVTGLLITIVGLVVGLALWFVLSPSESPEPQRNSEASHDPGSTPGDRTNPARVDNGVADDDPTSPASDDRSRVANSKPTRKRAPTASLDLLSDPATWQAADSDQRRRVAGRVASVLPGFALRGVERVDTTSGPVELATFTHAESGLEFVLVPAGAFFMGSPADEPGRGRFEQQHHVTLSEPFLMSTTEVSQEVWRRVMSGNPTRYDRGAKRPVTHVSWNDARTFCERSGLRLPSEAQWEFACRAGAATRYATGVIAADLERAAWFKPNAGGATHVVGALEPNAYGLYDMHGNVLEWCLDGYGEFAPDSVVDPVRGKGSTQRVLRGGSWKLGPERMRCAARFPVGPAARTHHAGFRPIKPVPMD